MRKLTLWIAVLSSLVAAPRARSGQAREGGHHAGRSDDRRAHPKTDRRSRREQNPAEAHSSGAAAAVPRQGRAGHLPRALLTRARPPAHARDHSRHDGCAHLRRRELRTASASTPRGRVRFRRPLGCSRAKCGRREALRDARRLFAEGASWRAIRCALEAMSRNEPRSSTSVSATSNRLGWGAAFRSSRRASRRWEPSLSSFLPSRRGKMGPISGLPTLSPSSVGAPPAWSALLPRGARRTGSPPRSAEVWTRGSRVSWTQRTSRRLQSRPTRNLRVA